jgi:hypothetical protein
MIGWNVPLQAQLVEQRLLHHPPERRLTAERERLVEMFRQAPGFMAMLSGPDHVFELTNAAYLQLIGHREVIGKAARDALPEVAGQGFFELLDRVYGTGKAFVGTAMAVQLQRTADGPVSRSPTLRAL